MRQFHLVVLQRIAVMMRKRANRLIIIIVSLFTCVLFLKAQTIFSALESKENTAQATVKIHQDKRIESLVYGVKKHAVPQSAVTADIAEPSEADNIQEMPGYRVQIYSSNVQKTAKLEAFRVEEEFQQVLPDVPVYVSYHSPFWKVRAGNCRTMEEAQQLRHEIGAAYPQVQKDLYVVHDKIKVAVK